MALSVTEYGKAVAKQINMRFITWNCSHTVVSKLGTTEKKGAYHEMIAPFDYSLHSFIFWQIQPRYISNSLPISTDMNKILALGIFR